MKKVKNNGGQPISAYKNKVTRNTPTSPSEQEMNALVSHYSSGKFDLAKISAEFLIKEYPKHPFGWECLGAIYMEFGRAGEALIPIQQATLLKPTDPQIFNNLGLVLKELGRYSEAEASCRQAIALKPDFAQAHSMLGKILHELGRYSEAEASYRQAIAHDPNFAPMHNTLGNILHELGRYSEAEASCRQAIALKPDFELAHNNLGNTLHELGRYSEAEASCRQAIALKPDFAEAHNNLGNTLKVLGRYSEAEASYREAITLKPDFFQILYNLGIILKELGRPEEAFATVTKSIKIKPTAKAKSLFISLLTQIDPKIWDQSLSQFVISALLEPWGRPANAMSFACRLLKLDKKFMQVVKQSKDYSWQKNYEKNFISVLSENEFLVSSLLQAILNSAPIPDAELEDFFTNLRFHLLKEGASIMLEEDRVAEVPALHCALAKQCFINEYVYFQSPDEIYLSSQLRDQLTKALEMGRSIPAICVIAVACYFPLYSVLGAEKLLQEKWSDDVNSVLKQQLLEPREEFNLRRSIQVLTTIENQVSLVVQSQYEESPYPRWVRLPKESSKESLNSYIQNQFPLSSFIRLADDRNPQILIAGSGTGQQPIGTSQSTKGANILAVDLSMSSLAYSKRKTEELDIEFIEYAQADILKLDSLNRTFDVIESSGVLHHIENPFEGWKVLLSLLRTHGLMKLGFYSEIARRDILKVRNLISKESIGSSPQEIRDFRKYLLGLNNSENYGFAISSADFFSTSTCRDLLFHVQEHRMNLKVLSDFINENSLNFLGFEADSSLIRSYKNRFPNDSSATNLNQWHVFEEENPNAFIGMYQFWVQKKN